MKKIIIILILGSLISCGQPVCDPQFWDRNPVVSLNFEQGNCGSYSTRILESLDQQIAIPFADKNLICVIEQREFSSCSLTSLETCISTDSGISFEIRIAAVQQEPDIFTGTARVSLEGSSRQIECIYDLTFNGR